MVDTANVSEMVDQYAKHGWRLQQILLTNNLFANLETSLSAQFGAGTVYRSDIDAVWFSRSNGDKISWEIRRLLGSPFALVRFVPVDATTEERDEILRAAEIEIANSLHSAPTEH